MKYSDMQPLGAVLDTGAQRRATNTPAQLLSRTGTTLNMQPGNSKENDRNSHGYWINRSVWKFFYSRRTRRVCVRTDPGMSDSLILAGRLMEAGCNVNFRMIPDDAFTDNFAKATFKFPLYRGSIQVTTPDNLIVIVMEYAGCTWRLPIVRTISK